MGKWMLREDCNETNVGQGIRVGNSVKTDAGRGCSRKDAGRVL